MKPVTCSSLLELKCMLDNTEEELDQFDGALIGTDTTSVFIKFLRKQMPLLPLLVIGKPSLEFSEYIALEKPFDMFQLCGKLQQILDQSKLTPLHGECISHPTTPEQYFNKDIRILIAEDICYNAHLLRTMLESLGYNNITLAQNGQEVLDLLEESNKHNKTFEIILLDLRMPVKNGFDVIDAHYKNKWKLPKIVVITASIMDSDREKCRNKGVQWFLQKPIELQSLSEVMLHVSYRVRHNLS